MVIGKSMAAGVHASHRTKTLGKPQGICGGSRKKTPKWSDVPSTALSLTEEAIGDTPTSRLIWDVPTALVKQAANQQGDNEN